MVKLKKIVIIKIYVKDRNVIMADFSVKEELLNKIDKVAKRFIVVDHHKTAREDLEHLPYAMFDMEHSGAVLAWEVFNPDSETPLLFKYIEDRDIWKWELNDAREMSAFISLKDPRDIGSFYNVYLMLEDENTKSLALYDYVSAGSAVLSYQKKEVRKIADIAIESKRFLRVKDANGSMEVVPLINATLLVSEVGEALSKDVVPAAAMFTITDTKVIVSLRSNENTARTSNRNDRKLYFSYCKKVSWKRNSGVWIPK